MEMIFGVIEDLIEKLNNGNQDEAEDAKNSLKTNKSQFITNLESINTDEARKILEKLKSLDL